ncbi:SDR family NAD(P)-dependent oxidoreductase [Natronospirillum operosum]|uniref:SDR family NAD(P)-dependent oxidoreductase n=1 Tax=Natronospirillum operosum TaxID=2759953 RepID=A0A4Z0WIU5_9GAMM|nr:SDR family NAD(P)-dependent oxidoreductase [Natronospirillum operosum]
MRLQDKVVLITGGASGIGLDSVERALEEGANAVIADLADSSDEQEAQRQYRELCVHPRRVRPVRDSRLLGRQGRCGQHDANTGSGR